MDIADYCRDIETHLCRRNDGHLIRIVGPSFEIVARWATDGVPLKVAMSGIDRYFERYNRKGPRRRPAKIDFCDADVRDAFDEWRRATLVTGTGQAAMAGGASDGGHDAVDAHASRKRGPSLPEHLERVLVRLSSLRATGVLGDEADPLVDRVSSELDATRAKSAGLRGDERRATVDRLAVLDAELLALAQASVSPEVSKDVRAEATGELASFRGTMAADAFEQAVSRSAARILRERLRLPVISFS